MPRLGPEEDHAFQENARVVTCAVKTNRICWSVHALDCCRTFKRDFQAKVKAKQARWLTIPGRMLELVSWLKKQLLHLWLTHVSPVFCSRFPTWTLLCWVESAQPEALTELVDKLNTAELEVEKAPHLTCVFKKKWQDGWKMCYPLDKNLWKTVYACTESDSSQNVRRQWWALLPKVGKWVRRVCGAWCVVRDAWNLLKIWGKVVKAVKAVSGPGGDHCLPKSGWTCLYLCDGLATWKKISLRPTRLVMHDHLIT